MSTGSQDGASAYGCDEISGYSETAAIERWRLVRLLEDLGNILSRLSLAHLSQTQQGLRLLQAQMFDGARCDLEESYQTLKSYRSTSGAPHGLRHAFMAFGHLNKAVALMEMGTKSDSTTAIDYLGAAAQQLKHASASTGEALFDTSACCGSQSNLIRELKDDRPVRLGT